MVLKNVGIAMVCATPLAWSSASLADEYRPDEFLRLLRDRPDLWLPDNLLLLQEYIPADPARGIVRMEFLAGELLYAMRFVSHGAFNLCPSETCNP